MVLMVEMLREAAEQLPDPRKLPEGTVEKPLAMMPSIPPEDVEVSFILVHKRQGPPWAPCWKFDGVLRLTDSEAAELAEAPGNGLEMWLKPRLGPRCVRVAGERRPSANPLELCV